VNIGNQQQLQRYAQPTRITTGIQDIDYPFSFSDWSSTHKGIIPGQEYSLYNQYLTNWYKNKATNTIDKKTQIKLNYLNLLQQLQLFFNEEEIQSWYNGINLQNEKELLLAIPYFAKKLKDIALYYLNLREHVKQSKIKYNLVGTDSGINLELQDFLLSNYTKKPNTYITLPASVWKSVPDLSAIQESINIEIEELYDTFQYLDHSPTLPVSAYYDINFSTLEDYFTSLGLSLTSTEWVYKTGIFELSGNQIIDSIKTSEEITNKYLNNDKFTSLFYKTSTQQDFYNISIETGNNYFYWPNSPYQNNVTDLPRYEPIALSAAGIENLGTGGETLETADTIFVKTAKDIQGAWLRYVPYDESNQTMKATLNAKKTTKFRFPFPGFGLSGGDLDWTGYDLTTNSRFFYLPKDAKKAVENIYWSSVITLTSHESININSTTLIDNKAYPSIQYQLADKIRIWPVPPLYTDSSYTGDTSEAWLYKFTQTDISIAPNSDTTIVWPYGSIDTSRSFPLIPEDAAQACLPTPLSSIKSNNAVASDALSSADLFLKVGNYQLNRSYATEGAWLSSATKYYPELRITMPLQPGLNSVFTPGNFTRFIWQGQNDTNINNVFLSLNHALDCKFITTSNTTYKDHSLCTCRSVLFTPFGHPGDTYTDNAAYCDYIVEDPFTNSTDFSRLIQTNKFAWFKTNSKIGFGDGTWKTGNGASGLILKTGKSYFYFRQNIRDQNAQTNSFPDYCVRYSYNNFNSNNFKWIQAVKNNSGNWVSTNLPSPMTLYSGENLIYSHILGPTFTKANSALQTQIINQNKGSIWTNYDYLTVPDGYSDPNTPTQSFILNYPQPNSTVIGQSNSQYPAVNTLYNNFVKVISWTVTDPLGNSYTYKSQSLAITPILTGIYTFAVVVMSAASIPPATIFPNTSSFYYANTALYTFNNIPAVTAISGTTIVYPTTAFLTPAPGFVLNTPLYGWDYNTSSYTSNTVLGNYGAKPFWATTANTKNEYTGYKGINSWGNYLRLIDGYNIISQPEISNLTLDTGNYVEYERTTDSNMVWSQPLKQRVTVDKNIWSTLKFTTTSVSNLNVILDNNPLELIVEATLSSSSLQLENYINNNPVEVYYNAISPFTWSISATPIISNTVTTTITGDKITNIKQPWANFPSRYYPNVAILPTVQSLSSVVNFGGFFVPQNLGATQYINKNYTINNTITSSALTGIYENYNSYIAGRGLTKEDQQTPFELLYDNNTWVKEPVIAGTIAGTVNKNIFKKYQKFIPYQTRYESNPRYRYGLITPSSLQTPWTGPTDTDWKDVQNYPVSFTGEVNVDKWADDQILKRFGLQLDDWATDIFGNQYGVYKNLTGVQPGNRKNTSGEIWVRKNSQAVLPASKALSGVFDTYKNTLLYDELTGSGVYRLDVFYDTLYIQTKNNIIFERLIYEYENDYIFSLIDDARVISLALPVTTNLNESNINTALSQKAFFVTTFDITTPLLSNNSYNLSGTYFLSNNKNNYIVSVGGVIQPPSSFVIDTENRTIRFLDPNITPHPSARVNVVQLFNPFLPEEYINTITTWILTSPLQTTSFNLPGTNDLSTSSKYYFVSIDGVLQSPYTYSINTSNRTINFSSPVIENTIIQIIFLPKLNTPASWTYELKTSTKLLPLTGDIAYKASLDSNFFVNIGGVFQPTISYTHDVARRRLVFNDTLPTNVPIIITQTSIPDTVDESLFAKISEPWFFPNRKQIVQGTCGMFNKIIYPELYLYDLNSIKLTKIFPFKQADITTLNTLSSLNLQTINTVLLTYNNLKKEFLLTLQAQNQNKQDTIIEIFINDYSVLEIKNITVYNPRSKTSQTLPPVITQPLLVTQKYSTPLSVQLIAENGSATYTKLSFPVWANLSRTGLVTGQIPTTGVYSLSFIVNNNVGPTYYTLTVNAI